MKIIHMLIAATSCLFTVPALAALPPAYQRTAELTAILAHEGLVEAFPQNLPIDEISYVGQDHYLVKAGKCALTVRIVGKPLPNGMVGARQFDVVFDKAECAAD